MICMGLYGIGSIIHYHHYHHHHHPHPNHNPQYHPYHDPLQHHTALLVNQNIKSQSPRQISVQDVLLRFTDATFDFM